MRVGTDDTEGTFAEVKARYLIDNEKVDVSSDTYSSDIRRSVK